MSRKRTVRRIWALVNPIEHAKRQASKLTLAEWNVQVVPVQVAIDRLSRGDWNKTECWGAVFECLNRIESLLKLARMPDHGFIEQGQSAFVRALDRHTQTGACALRADELGTLREMCVIYGDLLKEVTHAQFDRCCAHTVANLNRIISSKRGMTRVAGCVLEMA